MKTIHEPLHPGAIVKDALITSTGLTVTEAAKLLKVTRPALSRLLNGHVNISQEMAARLAKLLTTSPDMWINLQAQYDAWHASQHLASLKIKPLTRTPIRIPSFAV
jgi:addiction module HigA family antidote